MTLNSTLLQSLLDASPEGVVVCDARAKDRPVIYVNQAMQQLTGYASDEFVGRNMRFLQGEDHEQEGLGKLRAGIQEGIACRALLRNYRKDGGLFWNDLRLTPIRDPQGELTHLASFHRLGYERLRADSPQDETPDPLLSTQSMLAYVRDDKLTGLLRRSYFEDLLKRDWGLAQREGRSLTLMMFGIDFAEPYREVFGRAGAEQSFRRIARVVHSCFRRASDLCARWDEDSVAALVVGMDSVPAVKYAETILARVRDLAIHHPRSAVSRFLTISGGVTCLVPTHESTPNQIIDNAIKALKLAHGGGHNRVVAL